MTTTLNLRAGDRIRIPATLNSPAYEGTVQSVEAWMLTAGPQAGKQATSGRRGTGAPLWTVRVTDLVITGPAIGLVDKYHDPDATELHLACESSRDFDVI